jgi:hypothetical protein
VSRLLRASAVIAGLVVATVFLAAIWLAFLDGPLAIDSAKVCQLTGEEDRQSPGRSTGITLSFGNDPPAGTTTKITGSDLGFPFQHGRELRLLFGDTREIDPDLCEPRT